MNFKPSILILLFSFNIITSCSSYSKLAKNNKFKNDDSMTMFYNENLNFQSHTFGDFKFANNNKEFKRITGKKPVFKNILLYAKTCHPEYEYYLLLNAKPVSDPNYFVKDTLIDKNRITLAISKKASAEDIKVIASRLANLKLTPTNE